MAGKIEKDVIAELAANYGFDVNDKIVTEIVADIESFKNPVYDLSTLLDMHLSQTASEMRSKAAAYSDFQRNAY